MAIRSIEVSTMALILSLMRTVMIGHLFELWCPAASACILRGGNLPAPACRS